jgi:hypothetical protein
VSNIWTSFPRCSGITFFLFFFGKNISNRRLETLRVRESISLASAQLAYSTPTSSKSGSTSSPLLTEKTLPIVSEYSFYCVSQREIFCKSSMLKILMTATSNKGQKLLEAQLNLFLSSGLVCIFLR